MRLRALKIARVMGIPIYVHYSLLLILPFLTWSFGKNIILFAQMLDVPTDQLQLPPYFLGFLLSVGLFVSITLHELGHSWVALRQNIQIQNITLMFFGGIAQLDNLPRTPSKEAKIAIAGPLVSLVIALPCLFIGLYIQAKEMPDLILYVWQLGLINLVLALFNLLPAFPMDGGRIFRSLLSYKFNYRMATKIAAIVGKVFAVVFGIYGIYQGNFILIIIAFFVYSSASQETRNVALKAFSGDLKSQDLMTTPIELINADTPIEVVKQKFIHTKQPAFPVIENGKIVGIITSKILARIFSENNITAGVTDLMERQVFTVRPEEPIYTVLLRMNQNHQEQLLVVEEQRLVGIITRAAIMNALKY